MRYEHLVRGDYERYRRQSWPNYSGCTLSIVKRTIRLPGTETDVGLEGEAPTVSEFIHQTTVLMHMQFVPRKASDIYVILNVWNLPRSQRLFCGSYT